MRMTQHSSARDQAVPQLRQSTKRAAETQAVLTEVHVLWEQEAIPGIKLPSTSVTCDGY